MTSEPCPVPPAADSDWWCGLPFLPVTVLDARLAAWQRRKRAWRAAIGDGTDTRPGMSAFDPVLAQLLYSWFAPPGGTVLDPFAGGATRGQVAAFAGLRYVGVDVRAEQVHANRAALRGDEPAAPRWVHGDARRLHDVPGLPVAADLILTSPPYAGLERYSDQPDDLSTLDYPAFRDAHAAAIGQACARLAHHRFAVWVVGEARDRDGHLHGLTADTVSAFHQAGLALHAEMVLITPLGNLHMKVGRPFRRARHIGRAHQSALVFVKGDPARATAALDPPRA